MNAWSPLARVCGAWAHGKIHVMYQWLTNRRSCAHIYTCMPTWNYFPVAVSCCNKAQCMPTDRKLRPVPPPLCRWMADQLPVHDPLLPLHGPLREDKIPSEWQRQRRAARSDPDRARRCARTNRPRRIRQNLSFANRPSLQCPAQSWQSSSSTAPSGVCTTLTRAHRCPPWGRPPQPDRRRDADPHLGGLAAQ